MRSKLQDVAVNTMHTHPQLLRTIIEALRTFVAESATNQLQFITQDAADFVIRCARGFQGEGKGEGFTEVAHTAMHALCELSTSPHASVLQNLFSKGVLDLLAEFILEQTPVCTAVRTVVVFPPCFR
eukprot:SAG22_NODE_3832_length_1511_cov_7.269830_2_plen_127_part_00